MEPVKPPGRPTRAAPRFLAEMRRAAVANPTTLGYGFTTWSVARLAAHLAKRLASASATTNSAACCVASGSSFQRPKHTLKGKRDEAAYERAKAELVVLKKKR